MISHRNGARAPIARSVSSARPRGARPLAPGGGGTRGAAGVAAGRVPRRTTILVGLLSLLIAAACTADDIAELGGSFRGDQGRVALVLDLGSASAEHVASLAEPIVREAAEDGATLRVFIVTSGSVASMQEVELSSAARGGRFQPVGRNEKAWKDEAVAYGDAAIADIEAALGDTAPSTTGADLVGGISAAIEVVKAMEGEGRPAVYLLSGGAVERTERTDLLDLATPVDELASDAVAVVSDASGVAVNVIGAGNFELVQPPPSQAFTDRTIRFWTSWCRLLEERSRGSASSCSAARTSLAVANSEGAAS